MARGLGLASVKNQRRGQEEKYNSPKQRFMEMNWVHSIGSYVWEERTHALGGKPQ